MNIHYIKGDATRPRGEGTKIICHIYNDIGAWGAGFVLALSARWDEPEQSYRTMSYEERTLGKVSIVEVEDDILVANMIAQSGISDTKIKGVIDQNSQPPIRYYAVRQCLTAVNSLAKEINATLHMPRIGCGLAGGRWEEIEKILKEVVTVNVYVYDIK
jgi:O-acetyl-ADP-ribose deacetylase (regulator of RNase III)